MSTGLVTIQGNGSIEWAETEFPEVQKILNDDIKDEIVQHKNTESDMGLNTDNEIEFSVSQIMSEKMNISSRPTTPPKIDSNKTNHPNNKYQN